MVDYQDFTGRMDAFRTVDLRARVTGYVDSAPFKEGERVKAGDLLFAIDPRTYQAIVDQAAADVTTRKAEAVCAEAIYKRTANLVRSGAATPEDVDKQKGDADVAFAAIAQSEAKLREAKLNLGFCSVISPINGRISRRFVDPGNLVKARSLRTTPCTPTSTWTSAPISTLSAKAHPPRGVRGSRNASSPC